MHAAAELIFERDWTLGPMVHFDYSFLKPKVHMYKTEIQWASIHVKSIK